jgi:eukaryotic-like serine/threonine-protein kinase
VAEIILQIAQAVHAAHAVGIVHRDLKPENVMYDPATHQVKLLDFGIATATDAPTEDRLTRAGFFVGTLMYVAPEALSGEIVTAAADQYSLATIAYYLLTCTLPYQGKTPRELFTQLLSQPPIPLNRAKRGLEFGERVEAVLAYALSRDPAKRYPDTLIFAQELRSALLAPPVEKQGLGSRLKGMFRPKR